MIVRVYRDIEIDENMFNDKSIFDGDIKEFAILEARQELVTIIEQATLREESYKSKVMNDEVTFDLMNKEDAANMFAVLSLFEGEILTP